VASRKKEMGGSGRGSSGTRGRGGRVRFGGRGKENKGVEKAGRLKKIESGETPKTGKRDGGGDAGNGREGEGVS